MMFNSETEQTSPLRQWATRQLGLEPEASSAEARIAFLRGLPEDDFVPMSSSLWAVQALTNPQAQGSWQQRAQAEALRDVQRQRRKDVESFAADFWNLDVEDRQRRWQELMDLCEDESPLSARLMLLKPGLTLDPKPTTAMSVHEVELIESICRLFVLRPEASARKRQSLLRRIRSDMPTWRQVARKLQRTDPTFAQLEPALLKALTSWTPSQEKMARQFKTHSSWAAGQVRTHPPQYKETVGSSAEQEKSDKGFPWLPIVILLFVMKLAFFAGRYNSDSQSEDAPASNYLDHEFVDPQLQGFPRDGNRWDNMDEGTRKAIIDTIRARKPVQLPDQINKPDNQQGPPANPAKKLKPQKMLDRRP